MPKEPRPTPEDRLEELESLTHTALHATGGESIEGAFVDRYESYADRAIDDLLELLELSPLQPRELEVMAGALRQPGVPHEAAVRLLVRLRAHADPVLKLLSSDASESVRAFVGAALAERGGIGSVSAALADPSPAVRASTLAAVSGPDPDAQAAFVRALGDPAPEVRCVAARAVAFYRSPEGQRALLGRLGIESDMEVRKAILMNLAETTRSAGIHVGSEKLLEGIGESVHQTLLMALGDDDPAVREAAAMAMHRFGGKEVATAMLDRLRVEPDPSVRFALIRYGGFGAIPDEAFPVLSEIFRSDPFDSVRVWAGFLFASFGERAEPILLEALESPFQGVHRPAVMSLGKVGSIRALPALTRELARTSDVWYIREIDIALTDVVITDAYGDSREWPPDAAERVQALIDALNPKELGEWPALVCKRDLNALPLWGRGIDLWALKPDGKILCLDLDSVRHETWVEEEPLVRFAAMAHGAETYAALADLIPNPPKNARPCAQCLTEGSYRDKSGEVVSCMRCAGLGWVART